MTRKTPAVHSKEKKPQPAKKRSNPHGCGAAGGVDHGNGRPPVSRFIQPRQGQGVGTESYGDMKLIVWKDGLRTDQMGRAVIRNESERKKWEEASGQRYEG